MMSRWYQFGIATTLAILSLSPAWPVDLAAQLDLARCGGSPEGRVAVTTTSEVVSFTVRPATSGSVIRLRFKQPLLTRGKERLLLEARGEESSGEGVAVARIRLLGETNAESTSYEPDLHYPPEWNLRTILFSEFDKPVPARVTGIEIYPWTPGEVGKRFALHLRAAEVWSRAEVAAALRPPARAPRTRSQTQSQPIPPADQRWTSLGPGGGGWYRTVAFSPHDGACFVGADVGGIYRSTDNCRSWQMLNGGVPNLYVNCFAFHPTDPRIVFAGCNGGVLKSTDGGQTWQVKRSGFPLLMTFGQSAPISALLVDPERPDCVYAGVGHERDYGKLDSRTPGGKIYRSSDGGETWRMAELPGGAAARGLSVLCIRRHPRDRNVLFATTQAGLLRSSDAGASWQAFGKGLEGYATTFLAIRKDQPDIMLLAYHMSPAGQGGVLISEDGGATWQPSNQGLPAAPDCWRLFPHPRDPQTFFVGWHRKSGLFVTHDCGATWQALNLRGNIHSAWFFIGENVTGIDIDPRNPERLVYCNDMDLYQTLDGGKSWDQVATNLVRPAAADHPAAWRGRGCEVLCINGPQALAVDPTHPQTLYFGYMDAGAWKSEDGGRTCYRLTNGLTSGYGRMGCVALDPTDSSIVYLSSGTNDHQRIYKSVDDGRQFHLVGHPGSGLPTGGVFSLVIDPESPLNRRTVFAAVTGQGVYKSENGGLSWREQSDGLPPGGGAPMQLALDPKNPRRLFLATARRRPNGGPRSPGFIARTEDGGAHWRIVKDGIEPQCILIDPLDSQRIYAGNRNFSGIDHPNAFYRSLDGGQTWVSLGQTPFLQGPGSRAGDQGVRVDISCLAADPTIPGLLYAGATDQGYDVSNGRGVFVSRDWGQSWDPFPNEGLANFTVGTLVVDPANPSRLYVGTDGNGVFRFGQAP